MFPSPDYQQVWWFKDGGDYVCIDFTRQVFERWNAEGHRHHWQDLSARCAHWWQDYSVIDKPSRPGGPTYRISSPPWLPDVCVILGESES